MRRNSGIIGPKVKTTETDASGVHDTFDNYNAMKDGNWPLTLNVSSISISFNNTSTTSDFLWGDTITITVNGTGFTSSLYYTMDAPSGSNSTSYWADSLITGQLSGTTSSQAFSKRLKFQLSPVSSFTFAFQFRIGSATGPIVGTSAPITVAELIYDVAMPNGTEGSTYYYKPNFSGLTTAGTAYFYSSGSSWTSSEWSSTSTRYYYGYQANGATSQNHGVLSRDLTTEGTSHYAGYLKVRFNNNTDQAYNYVNFTKNGYWNYAGNNQTIYVNDTSLAPTFNISDTTPNEGDTITITVQAVTPSGTQFNVAMVNTTAEVTDYGALSATTIYMNSSAGGGQYYGQFTHTINRDFVTEGSESFYYQITAVEDGSPHNSPTVTIQDTTTLSNITVSPTSVNEGSSVTFTVNTIGAISGQTYPYYYRMKSNTGFMGDHDFTDGTTTGSFTISGTSNSGSFTKTLSADGYTEGIEVIKAEVAPIQNGPWVSSPTVLVADTSSGATEPVAQMFDDLISLASTLNGATVPSPSNLGSVQSLIESANPAFNVFAVVGTNDYSESLPGTGVAGGKRTHTAKGFNYNTSASNTLSTGNIIEPMVGGSSSGLSVIDQKKWMAMAQFDGTSFDGILLWIFTGDQVSTSGTVTSGTRTVTNASTIFYPNGVGNSNLHHIYPIAIAANGSSFASNTTSGANGWNFSNNQQATALGYYQTGRFGSDDGQWGFKIPGYSDGNSPGPSIFGTYGYGMGNYDSNDSNTKNYWNGVTTNSNNNMGFVFTGDA